MGRWRWGFETCELLSPVGGGGGRRREEEGGGGRGVGRERGENVDM